MKRTTKFRPVGRGLRVVNLLCLGEREGPQQCIASKEHSAALSNRYESRPALEEPSEEEHEEAPLGHDLEEPVVQRIEEPMVHQKEATERLSEKTESRG